MQLMNPLIKKDTKDTIDSSSIKSHNLSPRASSRVVSVSLFSVVLLATLVNTSLLADRSEPTTPQGIMSRITRGIASVPGMGPEMSNDVREREGVNAFGTTEMEDSLVSRLSGSDLSTTAAVGRLPSKLEALTLGFLEGKYAVQLVNGKIRGLRFSNTAWSGEANGASNPKEVEDPVAFLESHRDLLPVSFAKSVKIDSSSAEGKLSETFQLVNSLSMPVAKVRFQMDASGRLLAMQVQPAVSK